MDTRPEQPDETFPELIAAIKDTYRVSESEIARRLDLRPAAVNHWALGKRSPRGESLRKLHEAFPKFSLRRIQSAAGRRVPGPLSPDAEARILEIYRDLTEEQQRMFEVQMRAVREGNQSAAS